MFSWKITFLFPIHHSPTTHSKMYEFGYTCTTHASFFSEQSVPQKCVLSFNQSVLNKWLAYQYNVPCMIGLHAYVFSVTFFYLLFLFSTFFLIIKCWSGSNNLLLRHHIFFVSETPHFDYWEDTLYLDTHDCLNFLLHKKHWIWCVNWF